MTRLRRVCGCGCGEEVVGVEMGLDVDFGFLLRVCDVRVNTARLLVLVC
jgi:hypothetical protein